MKLYKHQQKTVDENRPKLLIAHDMGSGKTITALSLAKKNNVTPLCVVPKPVRRKWEREAGLVGVQVKVVTREEFRRDATLLDKYDAVIVDEVHYGFSNSKAQLHKKLRWYLKKQNVQYLWILTGTPYTSTAWSVHGLATILGYNWNYLDFRHKFFVEQWYGSRSMWTPREGMEEEIGKLVRSIGDVVPLEGCFDVPEQTVIEENFTFTSEQKKANKVVDKTESDPMARWQKKLQIASGVKIGNEFIEDEIFKSEKNTRIVEYCENNDKVVVFSRYNIHLRLLSEMLTKKKIPHDIINGEVDDKETVFEKAEKSNRHTLLINGQCSMGYEIPSFPLMIFASLASGFVHYIQGRRRILRGNALKKNVYVIMITDSSKDEDVWSSIKKGEDFDEAIFSNQNNI